MIINYENISKAIEFYKHNGYNYVEVPWYVSKEIIMMTKPNIDIPDYELSANGKYLIASGEQGFLYSIMKGYLSPGKYVTCTPCYRFESQDWLHRKTFMKVELINWDFGILKTCAPSMKDICKKFFQTLTSIDVEETSSEKGPCDILTPTDLTINNIEIGSYGLRTYKNLVTWEYGTGLAEPRFSTASRS